MGLQLPPPFCDCADLRHRRRRQPWFRPSSCCICFLLLLLLLLLHAACVAGVPSPPPLAATFLSIDFGCEWVKSCLTHPATSTIGDHLDVVINEQSNRKTPNVAGVDQDGERPARAFPHVKRLLGVLLDSPAASRFAADFVQLQLRADDDRGTVVFHTADGDVPVEEVIVQLLQLARRQAEDHLRANAESTSTGELPRLSEVVITVPEYFSAAQRALLAQLAQLAGFNAPRAIINELTAVAIDYAVRNLPSGSGVARVAFLGGGTMGVSAALVEMERVEDAIRVRVIRTASDASIGGYSFDVATRDALARQFDASRPSAEPIASNARGMAKLLREARALKEQLSVSPVIEVHVEDLLVGRDFHSAATQNQFAEWTAAITDRVIHPLREVMADAGHVDGIELFGGAVRVPSVQSSIRAAFPRVPLGKHVDGEEAALLGAAHYAGALSGIAKLAAVIIDESPVLPPSDLSSADARVVLSDAQLQSLAARIAALDARAEERRAIDAARNALESALNEARDLLSSPPKGKSANHASALSDRIAAVSEFVDDADRDTTRESFEAHHTQLIADMEPMRVPKKAPVPEKPSAPRKKRDRRAEYARAQEEAARQERAKKAQEKEKKQTKKKSGGTDTGKGNKKGTPAASKKAQPEKPKNKKDTRAPPASDKKKAARKTNKEEL